MAQLDLNNIKRIEKNRNYVHDRVYTTYTIFEASGEKYLQLDTYGRIGRDFPEKISQSIQVDKETARYLVALIKDAFEL